MKASLSSVATCAYCGLPLATQSSPTAAAAGPTAAATGPNAAATRPAAMAAPTDAAASGPEYCCFGCRFAATVAGADGETGQARSLLARLGVALFFTMNVMMLALNLWTEDVYGSSTFMDDSQALILHDVFRYACLVLTVPVLFLLGGPLAENVFTQPRLLARSTDSLLLLGVCAAFAYSMQSVLRGQGHIYFEVCCVVLVAVTLGRWFEATGKLKTTAALRSLEALVPDEVRQLITHSDGTTTERMIPAAEIHLGDAVVVLAGERLPVDGTVIAGAAAVDQQLITGEAEPMAVSGGESVYAGSLNLDGRLVVRVQAMNGQTAIDEIVAAVTAAAATKERYGRMADRVSTLFLPAVVSLAILTAAYWIWFGEPSTGILRGLAVVVISCPCALALATPMAIWSCFGRAAQAGVIVRQADALDQLSQVTRVCVDKTGTLTTGRVALRKVVLAKSLGDQEQYLHAIGRQLAQATNHPMAQAVWAACQDSTQPIHLENVHAVAGLGVRAEWHLTASSLSSGTAYLGNLRWMEAHAQLMPAELEAARQRCRDHGQSLTLLAWNGEVKALFAADEEIRPAATAMLKFFTERDIPVHLLTGDHSQRAARLAQELSLIAEGDLLPSDKALRIRQWQDSGERVLMIGDGVNDAPALAAADVSLAMGCGAEISRHTADVCLLSDDLGQIPFLFQLARDTIHTIRWNLLWAFAYNTLAIPLAMVGWVNPIVASIAMVVSSLMVVGNSLSLARDEKTVVAPAAASEDRLAVATGELLPL